MNAPHWLYSVEDLPKLNPFGSVLAERLAISHFADGDWSEPELLPLDQFRLHPGAHCLHYGSSCFEGLKAYRWDDGTLAVFRADRHAQRMITSAQRLRLPPPSEGLFRQMVQSTVRAAATMVPPAPGSLYLRPVLIGTDENIGAAAQPSRTATFYVLASPVGSYFSGGERALRLLVEDQTPRTTPQFGCVKTGANYAAALGITLEAKQQWAIDQILFCPAGDVQETGASNFLLLDDKTVWTKPVTSSFLDGVTRDAVLQLATQLGYEVREQDFTIDDLLQWTAHGEAALSGTAAVLAGVGTLIYRDQTYTLSGEKTGPNTLRLRQALNEIQQGTADDPAGWITKVSSE